MKRRDFLKTDNADARPSTAAVPAVAQSQFTFLVAHGAWSIRGDLGASILGPRNTPLERENPDQLASPYTDSGTIPNLKFSFAAARNRLLTGGWAREVAVRELPVAAELAGVGGLSADEARA
jgi:hypothetical protein